MLPPAPKITTEKIKNFSEKIIEPKSIKNELKEIKILFEKSKDELFHNYLYTFYIENKKFDELFQFNTSYLETFLQKNEYDNYLAEYYLKNEKYEKASKILKKLSEKENIELDLRNEYLSKAILSAKGNFYIIF
jgi:hypothetical protein